MKLYLVCLIWGLATGATAGIVFGALLLMSPGLGDGTLGYRFGLLVVGGSYGVVVGTLASVVPSAVIALVVTGLIRQVHPEPSTAGTVRRDLRVGFGALAGVLMVGLLLAIFAGGNGFPSVTNALPYVLPAGACATLVLCLAAGPISRASVSLVAPNDAEPGSPSPSPRAW